MAINIQSRKTNIVKSLQFTPWSSADFIINQNGNSVKISKDRLSDLQITQYIDLTKVIDNNLEIDISDYTWLNSDPSTFNFNTQRNVDFIQLDRRTLLKDSVKSSDITQYALFDGYKNISNNYLLEGNKRSINPEETFFIPFINGSVSAIGFEYSNGVTGNVNNSTGGVTESENNYVSYLLVPNNTNLQNSNWVEFDFGGDIITLYKDRKKTSLQPTIPIYFKNSYGVLELFQMNGRIKENVDIDSQQFKRSLFDINGNLIGDGIHSNKVYRKDGEKEYSINTGIIPEYMNTVLESLIMSKEVWIKLDSELIPVNMEDKSLNKKIQLEGIPNYTFNFKQNRKINE